jgi:hypothetical protein
MDNKNDAVTHYDCWTHVEPFHRQHRIDGTLSFSEQLLTMQHIVLTDGLDGKYSMNDTMTMTTNDFNGGIWKETLHNGIGQCPTVGATV